MPWLEGKAAVGSNYGQYRPSEPTLLIKQRRRENVRVPPSLYEYEQVYRRAFFQASLALEVKVNLEGTTGVQGSALFSALRNCGEHGVCRDVEDENLDEGRQGLRSRSGRKSGRTGSRKRRNIQTTRRRDRARYAFCDELGIDLASLLKSKDVFQKR